ncbi:MAG TPA: hypothetical protein VN026_14875 [Bacteroidia bacterium]|jgi:hypothetical protein|nr:hypothetical protein [Bacteroidia bacterium]
MADQEDDRPSFTCYNCKTKTFYNPEDYAKNGGGEFLIEMKIMDDFGPKTKDVFIRCSNPKCKCDNLVLISY